LECCLGHAMAAHVALHPRVRVRRPLQQLAQQLRREPRMQRKPRRVDRLRTVVRLLARHALRPRTHTDGRMQLQQQDTAILDHARRNAERLLQRKPDLSKYDSLQPDHSAPFPSFSTMMYAHVAGPGMNAATRYPTPSVRRNASRVRSRQARASATAMLSTSRGISIRNGLASAA